jgi:hypothetical protein
LASAPDNYVIVETDEGQKVLAHGRDPNYPGWPDTLQLDCANPELQAAQIAELIVIAEKCDGVRTYRGAHGRRVVEGQRTMQAASDIFLAWTSDEASERQFDVRVLKNHRLAARSPSRRRCRSAMAQIPVVPRRARHRQTTNGEVIDFVHETQAKNCASDAAIRLPGHEERRRSLLSRSATVAAG